MQCALLLTTIALTAPRQTVANDKESRAGDLADLNAHQAVREGNRQLTEGHPTAALEAYQHAEALEPDAREIAFVEGLAHYDLKEFDKAREAFRKAGAFASDSLADDALYSLGTSDHAEALQSMGNPELALSLLESAMGRYHEVLARQPEHAPARDANFKAASMWRELKQQLQQQPPQQQQSCDKDREQDSSDEKKEDQQPQQSEDQEQQDKQQQKQPSDQDKQQEEQQQSESAQQSEEQQQQQQAQAQDQEEVSREQARRKLREMMQALRDRKKMRRELVQKMPVTPVDKDW